jgi:hypothetical protein
MLPFPRTGSGSGRVLRRAAAPRRALLLPRPTTRVDPAVTGSRQIVFSSARRAPRRRWTRVGGITLGIVALLLLLAVVLAGTLWTYAWARLGAEQFATQGDGVAALGSGHAGPSGATTTLVVLTAPRDPAEPRAPELRGPVLLVQAGGPREVPAVLALPQGLPLTVDGAPPTSIEEVQQEGDVQALLPAIADYAGVRIDHVVSVSEDALPRLIELHRPEVCEGERCRTITPDEVRRAQEEGSVEDRIRASTALLQTLALELDARAALTSPLASKRTIDVVARDIRTDVSLRGTKLLDLARQLDASGPPDVAVVPMFQNPETGRAVLLEQAETLFQRFREGAPLGDAGPTSPTDADPAEVAGNVDIAILNGAGIAGLAARLEATLAAEGFRIVGTGNAPSFSDGGTVITYDPDDPAAEVAAILLAQRLEGATLQPADRTPTFEGAPVGVEITAGTDLDETD